MNKIWRQRLLLIALGLGLAGLQILALVVLRSQTPPGQWLFACEPAPGDWKTMVWAVTGHYRPPCEVSDWSYWDEALQNEIEHVVQLNNYGLHDAPFTMEKPEGVFRIVMAGDSFVQATQVPVKKGFPWLLEGMLDVKVMNMGVDAYGTDREMLLYAVLGQRLEPDLVLLVLYAGNDVLDNHIDLEHLRYGHRLNRPFFTLDENGILWLNGSLDLDPTRFPDSPAYQWLVAMQAQRTPKLPPENPPQRPRVLHSKPYTLEYPVQLGLYLPEDRYWAEAWSLTETLILQFRALVYAEGARFATVIIPDRRAVHPEDWDATLHVYAEKLPALHEAVPSAPVSRLTAMLEAYDIPTLNLLPRLRRWVEQHPGERLYHELDGHFNAQGHIVVAEEMAEWLLAEGLAPNVE